MVKITKALARKMYDNGEEIMFIPSRMKPTSPFGIWITKPVEAEENAFEKLCNVMFYYNCSPETGMTLHYYAKEV